MDVVYLMMMKAEEEDHGSDTTEARYRSSQAKEDSQLMSRERT